MSAKKTAATTSKKGGKPAKPRTIQVIEDPTSEVEATPSVIETKPQPAANQKPDGSAKRLSALDAAVLVLRELDQPLNAKQMVEAMTDKGYWTSPGGKTPHATLFSAIQREIAMKGACSRFAKGDRGKFVLAKISDKS